MSAPDVARLPASPRGHHAATARLLRWIAGVSAPTPAETARLGPAAPAAPPPPTAATADPLPALLALLGPRDALPDEPGRSLLKYDVYLAPRGGGAGPPPWGLAMNNRWEEGGFLDRVGAWVGALGGAWDWGRARAWAGAGPHPPGGLTFAVGLDRPGAPPRLKLYVQEPAWNGAVADAAALRRRLAALGGPALPAWIPDTLPIGVVTLDLHPDGAWAPRLYLGGEALTAALPAAPPAARAALARLAALCPSAGHAYLTVRLAPDRPPRLTANRIYNPVTVALTEGAEPAAVDAELDALFAEVGRRSPLPAARAALPGLRLAPTAVALDPDGPQVDLYVGAWDLEVR